MPNTTLYRASQNHNGCQLVSCFTLPHGRRAHRLVKTPTHRGRQVFKMYKKCGKNFGGFSFLRNDCLCKSVWMACLICFYLVGRAGREFGYQIRYQIFF